MKKRLAKSFLLAVMVVFVLAGYAQADFVRSGSDTLYQTESGTYLTGLQEINGSYYYFNTSGILQKGGWIKTPEGKEYYASDDGKLLRNQWIKKKYYVKDNCEKASGLTKIESSLFYFSPETGKVQTGKMKDAQGNLYIADKKGVVYAGTLFKYKKKNYYAREDGKLAVGLTKIGNDYYCFRKKNGTMYVNTKKKADGAVYYFTANGKAARNTWIKIKNKYYYFQDDGRMATSTYIGDRWYVDENGVRVKAADAPKAGVNKSADGKIYLYDESGKLAVSKWVKQDNNTYYAGTDGAALTGLQTIGTNKYYFNDEGVLQKDTIVLVNNVAYVVAEDGRITGTSDASGAAIAKYAQQFVGNPYVWGGTDPKNGADCSGFCYAIYGKFKIQLMRVADDQMKGPSEAYIKLGYKKGIVISDKDLLPGDLVFYGSASYASHVAMYIGNNKVVHAANSRLGIIISDMDYVKSRVKNKNMRYWA